LFVEARVSAVLIDRRVRMGVLATLAVPLQWGAAIRHRRVFHPDGILTTGSIARLAPHGEGLPIEDTEHVVARISKGVGTPGPLPDVIGLAMRLPALPFAATPWDILLASAGTGTAARVLGVRPVLRWTGQSMSSLMPLRYDGGVWWISARMATGVGTFGVSLASVRERLRTDGIEFDIAQARGAAAFRPLARLTVRGVTEAAESRDVAFDPVRHTTPGVRLMPTWLSTFREQAYERSRRGRHAD
jgi:hypothetical protein